MVIAKNGELRTKTGRTATAVVAASNSIRKDEADYICDGVDDHLTIQAIIDDASIKNISFLDGDYYCDEITFRSDLVLGGQGASSIFHAAVGSTELLRCEGSSTLISTLAVNASEDDTTLTLTDASSLAATDWIKVTSDRQTSYLSVEITEIHQIESIAGNVVTLYDRMFDYYNTADNAEIYKQVYVENVEIKNLELVGTGKSYAGDGVYLRYGNNILIDNCVFKDHGELAVGVSESIWCVVKNCHMCGGEPSDSGYGVYIGYSSQFNFVRNCEFNACDGHSTTVSGSGNGIPRFNYFVDNVYRGGFDRGASYVAADIHFGDFIYFINNRFIGVGCAIAAGATHTIVDGCTFETCGRGIEPRADSCELRSQIVTNCKFFNVATPLQFWTCIKPKHFDITNNYIKDSTGQAIYIRNVGTEDFERINISGNLIESVGAAIRVGANSTGENKKIIINDNKIVDVQGNGLELKGKNVIVMNNSMLNVTSLDVDHKFVIYMEGTDFFAVSNNVIQKFWHAGIVVNSGTGLVEGNLITEDRDSHVNYAGITLNNVSETQVTGNKILSVVGSGIRERGTSDYTFVGDNYLSKKPVILGANTIMYDPECDIFMDILAASATAVHAAITGTGAEQEITTGITNPDVPRNISITNSANSTGDVKIDGKDARGRTVSDTITIVTGGIAYGVVAFSTVSKITIPATVVNPDTISVGASDKLGLADTIFESGDVYKVKVNNADDPTIGTVNTTYHTVDCATINAADDITIWYNVNLNMIS